MTSVEYPPAREGVSRKSQRLPRTSSSHALGVRNCVVFCCNLVARELRKLSRLDHIEPNTSNAMTGEGDDVEIHLALKGCGGRLRPCPRDGRPTNLRRAPCFTPYPLQQWSGGNWERGTLARRASFDSLLPLTRGAVRIERPYSPEPIQTKPGRAMAGGLHRIQICLPGCVS